MSARPDRIIEKVEYDRDRVVREFFEPQLRRIGLAEDQIQQQDLTELEVSLQKVNDAIENPDSFGKLRLKVSAAAGVIIAQSTTDYHFELGILPILLERKGQILSRIKFLRPEQQLSELREDIVASIDDPQARDRLIETIDRRLEEQRETDEKLAREQANLEAARLEVEERQERLRIEIRERRSAIYHSFLERESVASVVGAILLLALAATLIIAMFTHVATSEVITNAFLLILGYFFGQATIRERAKNTAKEEDA